GALLNLPFNLASADPLPVVLYPTQTFRCVDSRLTRGRAFHSATLLPNGMVFILGGVVADPQDSGSVEVVDGSERLYLTATAELYDPSNGQFKTVADQMPNAALARAFHNAALINGSKPYQILVAGGITTAAGADPHSEVLAPNTSLGTGRLYPIDSTNGGIKDQLAAAAAPADLITLDPDAASIVSHTPQPAYTSAAFQAGFAFPGGGLAVADGIDFDQASLNAPLARQQLVSQTGAMMPRVGSTGTQRLGATLSPITADTALLWGGAPNPADQLGEYIVGLKAGTLMSAMQYATMAAVPMTQFHTATVLDTDSTGTRVLVAGGFAVESTHLDRQAPSADQAVHLLNVSSTGALTQVTPVMPVGGFALDLTCANPMRYRPAGYQSAVLLKRADGNLRVLLSGGAPSFVTDGAAKTCQDCEAGQADPMCSIGQGAIYSRSSGLQPTDEPMQVGRFGHTSTMLVDGNVLIVGGISRPPDGSAPRTVADAEIYNPRATVPPWDATNPATALDADDPQFVDISNLKPVVRAPGGQAIDPTHNNAPVKSCGDF
ncbi:MAG TPA: kelch repeat-containing protein, partial [Polyangia bacterium]|nr:kelch repeat-containing protein [Polyangia bacterium]